MNSPKALCALIAGEVITFNNIKYILSKDNKLCMLVKEDGLDFMQDTQMTLEAFINLCGSVSSKSLTNTIKKKSRLA